jgi:hypothetical protein
VKTWKEIKILRILTWKTIRFLERIYTPADVGTGQTFREVQLPVCLGSVDETTALSRSWMKHQRWKYDKASGNRP